MRVLNLSLGQDTGGQQLRLARAFRRYSPSWRYDSVTAIKTFYDLDKRYRNYTVKTELWPAADVVHLHNELRVADRFERGKRRKPKVIHYHGTRYRLAPEAHLAEVAKYGAVPIVSTLDLQAIAPDVTTWAPTAYDLDELASYRGARVDDGVLRVAHAPTNRAVKSTAALIAAVDRLKDDGAAIELDVIEGVDNATCLRRKAAADVYVDQVLLGYGCNAIEAWGLGLPVIAGVDPELAPRRMRQRIPESTRALMLATWGELPFYEASEDSLADALVAMLDSATRRACAQRGFDHVRRWHDAAGVVPRMRAVYESALT